ncbi:MAG TPA: alpha/beta fold hydrolase [Nannocystaceae bacterium]|nr:alpha/beta fold hydrolase [Nannocystaceae bacterium]
MPELCEIPDPVAGPDARGRIRIDRRAAARDEGRPPVVLLGGMTQTLASWGAQIRPLAETRPVIAIEARGQGSTELALADCSLPRHVEDFASLHAALALRGPVDLCGFSFGGRVALAIAAARPELVRKLVLSGVALDRGVVGRLVVQGWMASLRTGDLEALARVSLPDILGPAYLEANAKLVDAMIRASIERNRYDGVLALMRATLDLPEDSEWAPAALAQRVRAPTLCTGGALDRLAPPDEVAALAFAMRAEHHVFPDVGHTVAIEAPKAWRDAVVSFLDR